MNLEALCQEYIELRGAVQSKPVTGDGFSVSQVWRLDSSSGTYAAKATPSHTSVGRKLPFIHNVMSHVGNKGFCLLSPPLTNVRGQTITELAQNRWVVYRWINGWSLEEGEATAAHVHAAMSALASFHQASSDHPSSSFGPAPCVARRIEESAKWLSGDLVMLQSQIDRIDIAVDRTLASMVCDKARIHLPSLAVKLSQLQSKSFRLMPVMRDVWRANILFAQTSVQGFIDFDALAVDSPCTDAARLLTSLCGNDAMLWEEGANSYTKAFVLDESERYVMELLDRTNRVLSPLTWLRWRYLDGNPFASTRQAGERLKTLAARMDPLPRRQ